MEWDDKVKNDDVADIMKNTDEKEIVYAEFEAANPEGDLPYEENWPENDQSEVPDTPVDIEPPPPSLDEVQAEESDEAEEESNPPVGTTSDSEKEGFKPTPKPVQVPSHQITAPPMGYDNKKDSAPPNKLREQHLARNGK